MRRRHCFLLLIVAAATSLPNAARADDYTLVFAGAPERTQAALKDASLLARRTRAYPTLAAIRRAGAADINRLTEVLVASGYYAATVTFKVEAGDKSARATFEIDPGARFRIVDHVVVYEDEGDGDRPATFAAAGLSPDDAADGAALQKNQSDFLKALWNAGFPAARQIARRAEADIASGTATATYVFSAGPRGVFGAIDVEGAQRTRAAIFEKSKTWSDGEPYERKKLIDYRDRLSDYGLFDVVDVEPGAPAVDGATPIKVAVKERKPRTIGVGASYSTVEGPGGRLYFEHRNLFGGAERARAEIGATELEQSLDLQAERPAPGLDAKLFGGFTLANETTEAFDARTLTLSAGLSQRRLDDRLEIKGGLGLETSRVKSKLAADGFREERVYFVSAPLSVDWNTESDPLRLDDGARAQFAVTPYVGTDLFTRFEATARSRVAFGEGDRFTLAGRLRLAATAGSSLASLPANKRVFAGGGSSVRGYAFQSVGPLNVDGAPIGGRSAFEAAAESRAKIFGPVQLAAFIDAGTVSSDSLPDFFRDYQIGTGFGVRYFTRIGPIRADVAFPLERRADDAAFQLYISLGQAF